MDRFLVRSACGDEYTVISNRGQIASCDVNYKIASSVMYGVIGFFVVLIISLMVFTEPIVDEKDVLVEGLRIRSGRSRYGRYGRYDRRDRYRKPATPTRLTRMGKFAILFGTLAFVGLGYYMAINNSIEKMYNEDNIVINDIMTRENKTREDAVENLHNNRTIARLQQEAYDNRGYGPGSGLTIDL